MKFRSITIIYNDGTIGIWSFKKAHSDAQLRYYARSVIDGRDVKHIYFGTSEIADRT